MKFAPTTSHVALALVISDFGQFADPLDWAARTLGLQARVERQDLMESLALNRRDTSHALAEAAGTDRRTHFQIELFGRCQGLLVAVCRIGFEPQRLSMRQVEDAGIAMVVLNEKRVLGIQATWGEQAGSLAGQDHADPLIRLLPLNVFSRKYFQQKIELLAGNRKLTIGDAGEAVVVTLNKPWLYYDVPLPRRAPRKDQKLLPF